MLGCVVEGCEGAHQAKGYCGIHYDRVRRNGTPDLMGHQGADEGRHDKFPADRGCHLHPSCLACPEPRCVYDRDRFEQVRIRYLRAHHKRAEAVKELVNRGVSKLDAVQQVAQRLGIDARTVFRSISMVEKGEYK